MVKLNENFLGLEQSYLFTRVAQRVARYSAANPEQKIIKMGIGDVTLPLAPTVVKALHAAAEEMAHRETFHGYGPEQGYPFLRTAISEYYQREMGTDIGPDELLISDGAKSDLSNILDLFSPDNTVLISDPVYPVYRDTNIMAGRRVAFMEGNSGNGFLPTPDRNTKADIIYLCSPNNPTGAVYNREQLTEWVDFANRTGAVILFDAAYERFITDPALPRSIYQIPGARECAIEFCSLSKTAGFTGLRCGYTVVPKDLHVAVSSGDEVALNPLWVRRQTTKFNGVPYVVQRAAEAVFTPEGLAECDRNIDYYRANARMICALMDKKGIEYYGGIHSPYIWMRCPEGLDSWAFFDKLLNEESVVGTPGEGFGPSGKYFFRLTAFGTAEDTAEAMDRLSRIL